MENLEEKIKEYQTYKRRIEELKDLAEKIADELKAMMLEAGQDKMIIGSYKLSYLDYTRKDIDKKRLQAEQNAIYAAYLKETTYKRFIVA